MEAATLFEVYIGIYLAGLIHMCAQMQCPVYEHMHTILYRKDFLASKSKQKLYSCNCGTNL